MKSISVGRIVHYALSIADADSINRRRTDRRSIAKRIMDGIWPIGVQAHIGNYAEPGQVYPLLVTRVWCDEYGPGFDGVNGQVLLDGNDVLWVTSVKEGTTQGTWAWPEIKA